MDTDKDRFPTPEAIADDVAQVGKSMCGVCRAKDKFCPACPFSHPAGFVRFLTATPREFWLGENLPDGLREKIQAERKPEKRGAALLEDIFGALAAHEATRMVNAKRPRGEVKVLMSAPGLLRLALGEYKLATERQQAQRRKLEEAGTPREWIRMLTEGGDG